MKKKYDKRYRDVRSPKGKNVRLTPRDVIYLKALATHGDLTTGYLYEFTKHLYPNYHVHQVRLKLLYHELGLIERHEAQFNIGYNKDKQCVHRLSDKGKKMCEQFDIPIIPSQGWFKHQHMTATITAALELGAKEKYEHLEPQKYKVADKRFQPDALIALTTDKRRLFCIEADRATEQNEAHDQRKTTEGSFALYREWIGGGQYKTDLKTSDGMLVLFVTTNENRMKNAMEILRKLTDGKPNKYILFTYVPDFGPIYDTPPIYDLYTRPWLRVGAEPYFLNQ